VELAIAPRVPEVEASYQRQRVVAAAANGGTEHVVGSLLDELRDGFGS